MADITLREVKGSKLTHQEMDDNFNNLNVQKIEQGLFATNNTILIKDNSGELVEVVIAPSRIIGRLASGEIVALTAAQLKGLIEIAISDVDGLQDALDALQTDIDTKQDEITADSGWSDPTGTSDKSTFATTTVTTENLAEFVKAMYEALKAQGLLTA